MDINYSISFGSSPTKPTTPSLWAFCGVDILPAPDGAVLLRRQDDDRRHLVRRDVAAVLDNSRHFAPLNAHAQTAGDIVPELKGRPEQALPVLKQMAELGFLRDAKQVLSQWQTVDEDKKAEAPEVFIITCDRPRALGRLIESLAGQDESQRFAITVIDDSRCPDKSAINRELVDRAAAGTLPRLRYFGLSEREALLASLIHTLPHREPAIRYLLDRDQWPGTPTYGLPRNLALLLGAGQQIIVLDDDILARAIPAPNEDASLRFGSANDRRMAFGKDREAFLQRHPATAGSPLALTSEVLGASISTLTGRHRADAPTLRDALGDQWWSLPPDARVLKTQCGTFGDPGTGGNAQWIVNLPREDLQRLLAQGPSIGATLGSQAIWMGYSQTTLMRFGSMSAVTGLDNRALLPPYFPALRGEDFLFAIMTEKMHADGIVAGLPWGVAHLPVENRTDPVFPDSMVNKPSLRLFAHWLDQQPGSMHGDACSQLKHMAEQISALSQMDDQAVIGRMQQALAQEHLGQLTEINRCLAAVPKGTHSEFDAFIARSHEQVVAELQQPTACQALASDDGRVQRAALRQQGKALADALDAWPEILAAAKQQR